MRGNPKSRMRVTTIFGAISSSLRVLACCGDSSQKIRPIRKNQSTSGRSGARSRGIRTPQSTRMRRNQAMSILRMSSVCGLKGESACFGSAPFLEENA